MTPIGPRETSRMIFRIALLRRRGLNEADADRLADTLAIRDHERDDRRHCLECAQFQRHGGCFAQQQGWIKHAPQRERMWRCEAFEFSRP